MRRLGLNLGDIAYLPIECECEFFNCSLIIVYQCSYHKDDIMSKTTQQLTEHFDELADTMHDAEKSRTLEEQVAYLKSQGIDPSKTYAKWDDDEPEE